MALHIFVDKDQELIVHIIRGDDAEAARFLKHPQEHRITHIQVKKGNIAVGD
jgi:hypothetical protein